MQVPSHKTLIEKYLDWTRVESRLQQYQNINNHFSLETLQSCSTKEPYFCHYLAWRLGTWESENLFETLDSLLFVGSHINNWDNNRNTPRSCSFDEFWGFVWELQVANYFYKRDKFYVEWGHSSGPDLRVQIEGKQFFVECTTYRKSYGMKEFIGEIFQLVCPDIKVAHIPFCVFSLPQKPDKFCNFLDELFQPYLNDQFLEEKLTEAHKKSPLLLTIPEGANNFFVFLEVDEPVLHEIGLPWQQTGDPIKYLSDAIEKILNNKRNSNNLIHYHPNLLAANFLLDTDFQTAVHLDRKIPEPNLGHTFDGAFFTSCGIDKLDIFENYYVRVKSDHPIKKLIEKL